LVSNVAKAGEGANHPDIHNKKWEDRVKSQFAKPDREMEERQCCMMDAGLFICSSRCPLSQHFCRGVFTTKIGFEKHAQKDVHDFPKGVNARDWIAIQSSKPGGAVAVGSRPDRKSKSLFSGIVAAAPGALGSNDAKCHGCFNRKEATTPHCKPDRLLQELLKLFDNEGEEKKLTVKQFRDRMKMQIDPEDGGLLFCYSKKDTNRKLLSEDSITQWINSETQKRRKQGKKKKNQDKIDNLVAEEKRLTQEHKAEESE